MVKSALEDKFERKWEKQYPEIPLIREYKGITGRQFRFDFVHLDTKIVIEIQGGTWSGGRHTTGSGLDKEYEKHNLALSQGWRIFQLSTKMITDEWLKIIASTINTILEDKYSEA